MRAPRTIKAGSHKFSVELRPAKEMQEGEGKNLKEFLGDTDLNTLTIKVKKYLKESKAREVLLHEVLHVCVYPNEFKEEEELVNAIAPVLLQILRDNPRLVEYLCQK